MDAYAKRYDTEPSSFTLLVMLNRLAHLAVDKAKRQPIDTAVYSDKL